MSDDPRQYEPPRHIEVVFADGALEPVVRLFEPEPPPPPPWHQFIRVPLVLFVCACVTTALAGGVVYSAAIMTILLTHELGHYLQAVRYRVPASLPYFIPFPAGPIGTMGAVITMRGGMGNRRSLFDIGISGPLAGLVPTLICCVWGLANAQIVDQAAGRAFVELGDPLILRWLIRLIVGPIGEHQTVTLDAVGYAGWVGLLITSLNLIPIGQLDGGHILYALLRKRAHVVAWLLLIAAVVGLVVTGSQSWWLMLILLLLMGPAHPPTANDEQPLGWGRTVLGWLTLAFVVVGFTPEPFAMPR